MGTIWIKDFKGGLDTRRMPETLAGGSVIRGKDGHTNRGGEFEQRAAFVKEFDLPAGLTVGIANDRSGIFVFGSGPAPVMPRGVGYQRLQHPDGTTALFRIVSFDLFAGKMYVVAEFVDGSMYHYYDGVKITDWQDGRGRASFQVAGGSTTPAVAPTSSFTISAGTAGSALASILLGGISIMGGPVLHTGINSTTAAAIVTAINAYASSPEYSAAAVGSIVTISGPPGLATNGLLPVLTMTQDFAVTGVAPLAGGVDATASQLTDLQVNGVSIIDGPVNWAVSNEDTAATICAAINAFASFPDYTSTVVGNRVNVLAADAGLQSNGVPVAFTLSGGFVVSPGTSIVLANALAPTIYFQSGTYAKTVGSKVYVTAGPSLQFSGIKIPSGFQTADVGAGFIDLSTEAAGFESLQAVAKYLQYIAVFAGRGIQIWYVDPDPTLNKQAQTLNNMGTISPRTVTQFGDSDLFFLDESGLRSLKARNASVAAATTDIGIPVDTLVVDKLTTLTVLERSQVKGLIEPSAGRFWLVFPDEILVFSFFEGSKISAWTTYTPGVDNVPFTIDDINVFKKKVYVRSGDKIYVYGGLGAAPAFDSTSPELWTPYLDAGAPGVGKEFSGIDVACEGQWTISAGLDPTNLNASDEVANVSGTTYSLDTIPFEHTATHISLRFKGVGPGAKKIAAATIYFKGEPPQ